MSDHRAEIDHDDEPAILSMKWWFRLAKMLWTGFWHGGIVDFIIPILVIGGILMAAFVGGG